MSEITPRLQTEFDDLSCGVIIPTYNNHKTLKRVISGVLNYTNNLIIVNDGSTDHTSEILKEFSAYPQIHFRENKGKGEALKAGFKKAEDLGYDFVITIDSDGQHYPSDLIVFIEALQKENTKHLLLIGSRTMTGPNVPKKSSFGNKFSNFWFWIETGIKLDDTQSGYRLYPVKEMNDMRLFTNRFEFEIEAIVKAAWRKVQVKNVPVKVLYDPEERVSHFRPFKDFFRISVLNTFLVATALVYIFPRNWLANFKDATSRKNWFKRLISVKESPIKKTLSLMLGVFIGISPFWGFQTLLVLFLAQVFKLNKAIAFLASNISLPPLIPFIVFFSYHFGGLLIGKSLDFSVSIESISENVGSFLNIKQYIFGAFAFATAASLLLGIIFYFIFSITNKK